MKPNMYDPRRVFGKVVWPELPGKSAKTYQCFRCGDTVRQSAVPDELIREGLCADCYGKLYYN